jgi:hypothetical protein
MWPDEVDEIITSDQALTFGYLTPAKGVVLSPLTNFAIRDRGAAVMSNGNSSVGAWKKLARLQESPNVAMAFHTRVHGFSARPEYVLVHGRASVSWPPPHDYVDTISESLERFGGVSGTEGRIWKWWMRDFMWRVPIDVAVERVVVWPDQTCTGTPSVYGLPWPSQPPPAQPPPRNGMGPRVNHRRAARRAQRLPHVLLGWAGTDGFPVIAPVRVDRADRDGILLSAPPGLLPPADRRAGFTSHKFSRYTWGQTLRKYTGWLDVNAESSEVRYAPHTQRGYAFPASKLLFTVVAGAGTRLGVLQSRRAGFLPR